MGIDGGEEWIVEDDKPKYDEIFQTLKPVNGKVKGSEAKKVSHFTLHLSYTLVNHSFKLGLWNKVP